jgi:glycosyltransferase involved in cell wall biosynthesis
MSGPVPRITAMLSTYASERFMRGCLEDLVAQTIFSQVEVIIIDAASPENERAIVEEFQRLHPNLRYLRTAGRIPLYAAWNRAIEMARGDYLTNANADDRHAPHAFEALASALDARPDVGVVYASTAITRLENALFGTAPVTGHFKARRFDRRRLFRDCLPGPQPMWRRSLHERFGTFDESFRSAGDYEFWLRISGEVKFLHLPEVLGLFLDSPQSISHDNSVSEPEAERARERHWPPEWGPRPMEPRSLLDRLTRRGTWRDWWKRVGG